VEAPESGHREEAHSGSDLNRLPSRQPPLASSCWLHGSRPGPGEINVIVSQQALRQISLHGNSSHESELGGALLGTAYRHDQRIYVDIQAALPAVSGDHGPVHFTFSADSWAQLQVDRSKRYPDLDVVGWYHTHPDLGVFYSGDDVVVHSAAFTLPWHVGLVVDPIRKEGSFFGWAEGQIVPISGFYERHGEQEDSAAGWKDVSSAVWRASEPADGASSVYAPANGWPGLPSFVMPLSVLTGVLGLLVGFFLLVGWVLPMNRQMGRLEDVVLKMADGALAADKFEACPDSHLRILSPISGEQLSTGEKIAVVGTVQFDSSFRYRVEMRSAQASQWMLLASRRRSSALGELATWDTSELQPGLYELRLTAVDRNNIILTDSPSCMVEVELVP